MKKQNHLVVVGKPDAMHVRIKIKYGFNKASDKSLNILQIKVLAEI